MSLDHGLPLTLGARLAPSDSAELATLARAAEEAGADILTVDLPESDPWTAMSWLAGATKAARLLARIDVGEGNPAVLARAAASLDLLTAGRLELLLTGSDPAALRDVVRLLPRMWDPSAPVHLSGERVQLSGAPGGPAPAHRIPVHLHFTGTNAKEIAGHGDGAVLSSGTQPLLAAQREIDAQTARGGREPGEVRRIRFLTGEDAPAALALDAGADTLIWTVGDHRDLVGFARGSRECREAVAAERRARGTRVRPVVPAKVRRLRRAGIDYDSVPAELEATAVEPGDPGFSAVRSTYIRSGNPGLVLRPATTAEVQRAIGWASRQDVPLSVRSGGHGFSGRSTNNGGIVVDLAHLSGVEVGENTRVRIGPGARWGDVAAVLAPHGLTLSSGDSGGVGVGGLATAGGIGFLSRSHGLTIDRITSLTLVLANGEVTMASETENPELFFGMRGAGFNFGVVAEFEFDAAQVTNVGAGQFTFDISADPARFLHRWGAAVDASPRDTTSFLTIGAARGGQLIAHTMNVVDSEDPETILDRLRPLADSGRLLQHNAMVVPYHALVAAGPRVGHQGAGEPTARSGLLETLTEGFAAAAAALLRSGRTGFFQIRALGGATGDVAPDATAFAHRNARFSVLAMGAPRSLDPYWDVLRPHFTGLYVSFETGRGERELRDAFPPATLNRLRALKRRYDPTNVFRDNFNIDPAGSVYPSTW